MEFPQAFSAKGICAGHPDLIISNSSIAKEPLMSQPHLRLRASQAGVGSGAAGAAGHEPVRHGNGLPCLKFQKSLPITAIPA